MKPTINRASRTAEAIRRLAYFNDVDGLARLPALVRGDRVVSYVVRAERFRLIGVTFSAVNVANASETARAVMRHVREVSRPSFEGGSLGSVRFGSRERVAWSGEPHAFACGFPRFSEYAHGVRISGARAIESELRCSAERDAFEGESDLIPTDRASRLLARHGWIEHEIPVNGFWDGTRIVWRHEATGAQADDEIVRVDYRDHRATDALRRSQVAIEKALDEAEGF